MSTLKELLVQQQELEKQISEVRKQESAAAIATIKELVKEFSLKSSDIFQNPKQTVELKGESKKVTPKYKNPETGATWTGRGMEPNWIKGLDREKFLIPAEV